jgi:hypothetical protein
MRERSPAVLEAIDEAERQQIQAEVIELVKHAERMGFVVEVYLVPMKPLAMGNYAMAVDVRKARHG